MKDDLFVFAPVTLVQRQNNLCKNAPNLILAYELAISRLAILLDKLSQVAALAVLHHQVNARVLLVNEFVVTPHDILVLELAQNVNFVDQLLLFFIVHTAVVCLLPDHFLTRLIMPHQGDFPVGAYSKT